MEEEKRSSERVLPFKRRQAVGGWYGRSGQTSVWDSRVLALGRAGWARCGRPITLQPNHVPHLHGAFFAPARAHRLHRLTRVPVKENKRHRCSGCWLHTHNASVVIVRPPFCFLSSSLCTCTLTHTCSRVIPAPSHDHNPALSPPRSGPRTPLRPFRTWPAATAPAITRAFLPDPPPPPPPTRTLLRNHRVHFMRESPMSRHSARQGCASIGSRGINNKKVPQDAYRERTT